MFILNFVTLHNEPSAFFCAEGARGSFRLMRFGINQNLYQTLPRHCVPDTISRSDFDNPLKNGDIEYSSIPNHSVTVVSVAVSPDMDELSLYAVIKELNALPTPPILIREMIEIPGAENLFKALVENNILPHTWGDVQQMLTSKRG